MTGNGADEPPIIVLRGVHKWFGQFHVLKDINMDVWKGQRVVVCGLATDYCVNATVLDSRRLGFETVVVVDACAPVNLQPDDGAKALAAMSAAGAELTGEAEVAEAAEPAEPGRI